MATSVRSDDLTGKVAVVTGSSRGIGRAVASRLGAAGAAVVVNYVNDAGAAQSVVDEITAAGGQAEAVRADVSDLAQIPVLFDAAERRFGGVDIVLANVGTIVFKPVAAFTVEEFDRVFAVNARGTFFVLQEAARRLRDGGRLMATSTGGTVAPGAGGGAYAGSKAAVEQFIYALAHELGDRGITANVIVPGVTRTDGLSIPQQYIDQMISRTPLGRLGEPDDIAQVVAFLAGDGGRWVTGQSLRVGGGLF